jgi:hypothetical protein
MALFGLLKSREQREMEAQLKVRQGKGRIQRYIQQAKRAADRSWQLAKQAFRLGDQDQFRKLAANYLHVREEINRWERYLVRLDTLELRRNQMAAAGEFMQSVQAMSASIMRGANPEDIAKMQLQLEQATHKVDMVEQTLDMAIENVDDALMGTSGLSDELFDQISRGISREELGDAQCDAKLDAAINKLHQRLSANANSPEPLV